MPRTITSIIHFILKNFLYLFNYYTQLQRQSTRKKDAGPRLPPDILHSHTLSPINFHRVLNYESVSAGNAHLNFSVGLHLMLPHIIVQK
jgi:hypothetical protein